MFAPKARAILTGSTPRKVTVLHRIDCGEGVNGSRSEAETAYHVRTTTGTRLTVPGSQLQPRNNER